MGISFYKKLGVCTVLALCASAGASAQTVYLLDENFESGKFPPAGWSVINSTEPGAYNHWDATHDGSKNSTVAYVKGLDYDHSEPVKEEILITPEIMLNGYYDLQFTWQGATAASIAKPNPEYDFQVRIKVAGSDQWEKIFSFLDEDMVRNSGIAYPWSAWAWNPSSINLTDWNGKTVQFAFVVCKLIAGAGKGNGLWLDDVKVVSSKQITGPIAEVTPESYIFPTSFIGSKKYSEPITLKNTGRDVLTVTGVTGLTGTDFGCTIDPAAVSLKTGDTYQFQFWYEPTEAGGARATATIQTNGGNVNVALSGTKKALQGGTYEGFEGDVFPPLGWTRSNNNWYQYGAGLTGDHCAICVFPDSGSDLITPRLDLSKGDQALQFTFYESYDPQYDDSYGPANYFKVYLSTDGKKTWKEIFDSDDQENYPINEQHSVTLELAGQGSDDCYIKFSSFIQGFSMSDYDEIPDYSMIYIDDVVLPALYGSTAAPAASKAINPENGAKDIYTKNLKLEWSGELFATNYKLYVGKSATSFDVVDGQDMGTATSYTIPRLDYATTYYWKVVGYNGTVANNPTTWSFTTIPDQTVTSLPYSTNFDDGFPLGWNATKEQGTGWSLSNYNPYGGTGQTPMASGYQEGTTAILETPDFQLPAGQQPIVSFLWGNAAPTSLIIDSTGTRVNNTKEKGSQCTIFFDILDGDEWKCLGMLHEEGETKYWYRESFDLTPYAGKTVAFRWRYEVYNYMAAAASVDNFLVQIASADKPMVAFSPDSWDAGYVNYDKSVTTRNALLLQNIGLETLKVKSATFAKSNFSTDLKAGTEIASNRSTAFTITYNAGTTAGEVADALTVTFDNGMSTTFPVKGTTLASDIYYYDFEADEHTSTQPQDFVTIDRDGLATVMPVLIYYEKRGAPFAYIVLNITSEYADWRNVYPVSGEQVLASMGESTSTMDTDDWIISPKMTATDKSNFRFFAKCYGDENQAFSQNKVEVLVSTEGDKVDKSSIPSFETVMASTKLPWSGSEGKWTEYNVDLSKYAGKEIWIALRHTTDRDGFVSFFDDFWFEHFTSNTPSGIQDITILPADGATELYNINGIRVDARNAAPGIYIKRNGEKTQKVIIR